MTQHNFAPLLFSLILFCFLLSCGGSKPEGCKYAPPQAIFAGIDSFTNHSFEVAKQDGIEKVTVPKLGMDIELYQSGCDFLQQEFRFHIPEAYPLNTPPEVCALHIANIFTILSQEAPQKLGLLGQWAEAIRADAKSFQYNEKTIFQGTAIKAQIDKTHQTESAILSIVFEQ